MHSKRSKILELAMVFVVDESPQTCQMFLDEHGLELFINVLQTFRAVVDDNRVQVETKVLGLIVSRIFFCLYNRIKRSIASNLLSINLQFYLGCCWDEGR